jgi:hypothetical protein
MRIIGALVQRHLGQMQGGAELRKLSQLLGATVGALLLAFTVNGAEAETTYLKWNKSTAKGRAFVLAEHWDVNQDCSVRAFPTAKIVSPPRHGKTKIGRGKITLARKYAKDPYYKCKSLTVSGTKIQYTPDRGFIGKDVLKIRAYYSTGDIHEIDIVVTVR